MIILAPKAGGPAYQKAAQAFRDLYAAVTGITLTITTEPTETEDMVIIGTDAVQPYGFYRLQEGFPVRLGTDDYCIISLEEADRTLLFLGGGRGRSTLYAVYDFFERRAGCHYFWDGDVIPKQDTVDIRGLNIAETPRFEYRAIRYFAHRGLTRFQAEHWDFAEWKQEIDWVVKARLNMVMLRIGMDDLFQKAFPESVAYPPEDQPMPGAGTGYNNRTTAWPQEYRGQLRKRVLQYAFDCDLMHPEDFGTMTHWYSRTPVDFLENEKPTLMRQLSTSYSEQTGQVWDIFDNRNIENYQKLTDTHVKEYGKGEIFHTIGLAERTYDDDPRKNLELKKYAYKRFLSHIQETYPNAKFLIAAWDFFFRLKPEEVKEVMKLFDPESTIVLDYTVDLKYEKSNMDLWGIQGKYPWIFGLFHGYMPQSHVHGDYAFIQKKLKEAAADPCCKGMDFWPELSHSDTLMLTYFTENAWKPSGRSIDQVAEQMCRNRYVAHTRQMEEIWQTFVPLLNLPDIDYTCFCFNLLQNGILKSLADVNNADHGENLTKWTQVVAEQRPYDGQIITLLQQVRALPQEALNDKFIHRDCVDLVRSAITQKLHIDYIDACIAFAGWQKGQVQAETVLAKWDTCQKLLEALADVLDSHEDYSMFKTLCDQGRNRKVNPFFEDALKDNLLNNYCRTAAYELVKYVYCKESGVFAGWIRDCIAAGKAESLPADVFEKDRIRIFDEFKALPLADMHPAEPCCLHQVIDRMLTFL